jgi:tetratricopeptide (TPR) repeat protein
MTATTSPDPRRRAVLALVGLMLAAMFASSFLYRLEHPTIEVPNRRAQAQGQQGAAMNAVAEMMQQLKENPDDVGLLTNLGRQFLTMGAWDRAENFFGRALVQEPTNTDLMGMLAVAKFRQDQHQEAAQLFEQIIAMQPDNAQARFNLAAIYKHFLDREAEAQALFREVVAMQPEDQELVRMAQEELEGE